MLGVITDGDLRREIDADFLGKKAAQIMTPAPLTLSPKARISEVIDIFTENRALGRIYSIYGI